MLRNHRQVRKTVGHNYGSEMAGASLIAGVTGMQMRLVNNVELRGVERLESVREQFEVRIRHDRLLRLNRVSMLNMLAQPDRLGNDKDNQQAHQAKNFEIYPLGFGKVA